LQYLLKNNEFISVLIKILQSNPDSDTSIQILALFSLFRGNSGVVKQLAESDAVIIEVKKLFLAFLDFSQCFKSLSIGKIPIRQVGCVLLASMCAESPKLCSGKILGNGGLTAILPLIRGAHAAHVPQILLILKCVLENQSNKKNYGFVYILAESAVEQLRELGGVSDVMSLRDTSCMLHSSVSNNLMHILSILSKNNEEIASCKQSMLKRKTTEMERPIVKQVKR
jgi:hypothetical protein